MLIIRHILMIRSTIIYDKDFQSGRNDKVIIVGKFVQSSILYCIIIASIRIIHTEKNTLFFLLTLPLVILLLLLFKYYVEENDYCCCVCVLGKVNGTHPTSYNR